MSGPSDSEAEAATALETAPEAAQETLSDDTPNPAVIMIHENFQEENGTDLVVQSSDGVNFYLHRKYLEATTGSFPGPEIGTAGEIVRVSEPAGILELLFQFVRPERLPHLRNVDFKLLSPLAEAANKYQVFAAMSICESRLMYVVYEPLCSHHQTEFLVNPLIYWIPAHAREILVHGIKHDYPTLIDMASQNLAREPLLSVLQHLPVQCMTPWIQFKEAWKSIFSDTIKGIKDQTSLCDICKSSLTVWVLELEMVESVASLNAKIAAQTNHKPSLKPVLCAYLGRSAFRELQCKTSAEGLKTTCAMLRERIKSVPPFSQLLKGKRKRND